ncbi:MAG: 4-hydroxy-3-methylbut-2-enyl diphosphate reductase [Alphaproteobacteria bacterium]|jgi:4-hydroxy-3-methylbut-2-enyl diphosphate reductase
MEPDVKKKKLTIMLAAPRGFCAGVERAIQIVEQGLKKFGAPVYVRHEIVHNKYVVESLEEKGAIFVDELDEVPADAPVVFSAHGVPKSVPAEAERRNMTYIDATCPLVSKVHREAERHYTDGHQVLLIGHAGHPEIVGTMGQLPDGAAILVETREQAETVECPDGPLAYITQTTLSVDDTGDIVDTLRRRFPNILGPRKEDICYATTNRQMAVKAIADQCDVMFVVGAPNSSNSKRLVEVGLNAGLPKSTLVQRAVDIDWDLLGNAATLGLTAGASAPDILVEEVISACRERFDVTVEEITTTTEMVEFKLPRILTA